MAEDTPVLSVTVAATPENDVALVESPFQAPAVKEPWDDDSAFKDWMKLHAYSCPGSNVGDHAWYAWVYTVWTAAGGGGSAPVAAPTLSSVTPATGPAAADITVALAGTGFDAGATVDVGGVTLTPEAGGTATDLSVIITAAAIPSAGPVQVAVKNSDGQWSNQVAFDVT